MIDRNPLFSQLRIYYVEYHHRVSRTQRPLASIQASPLRLLACRGMRGQNRQGIEWIHPAFPQNHTRTNRGLTS
jgi:hypothetical protein